MEKKWYTWKYIKIMASQDTITVIRGNRKPICVMNVEILNMFSMVTLLKNDELKENRTMNETGTSTTTFLITQEAYFKADNDLQEIIADYKNMWKDSEDSLRCDEIFMRLNKLRRHLKHAIEWDLEHKVPGDIYGDAEEVPTHDVIGIDCCKQEIIPKPN